MTYIIAEPCIGVKDRSCVEVCPVDCIYEYVEEIGGGGGPGPPPPARGGKQGLPPAAAAAPPSPRPN